VSPDSERLSSTTAAADAVDPVTGGVDVSLYANPYPPSVSPSTNTEYYFNL